MKLQKITLAIIALLNGHIVAMKNDCNNIRIGCNALELLDSEAGYSNVAIGPRNTLYQLKKGTNNVALGTGAGAELVEGNYNTYIQANCPEKEERTIRIGFPAHQACYISGIYQQKVGKKPLVVIIDEEGKLGTTTVEELLKSGKKE